MEENAFLDEERIREITESLSEIEALSRVLDGEYFKGKPITFFLSLSISHRNRSSTNRNTQII